MSRIGKKIITIPANCSVEYANGVVTVTGTNGVKLSQEIKAPITVEITGNTLEVKRPNDDAQNRALHGLYNRLIDNMVVGVTKGFTKTLILHGVGYKIAQKGAGLTLSLGMSHSVDVKAEEGITFKILNANDMQQMGLKEKVTAALQVQGASREQVGAVASKIRGLRKVEPYHLYGIRYSDEHVNRKESKSGAKKKK